VERSVHCPSSARGRGAAVTDAARIVHDGSHDDEHREVFQVSRRPLSLEQLVQRSRVEPKVVAIAAEA
jgi:hypothetical protein